MEIELNEVPLTGLLPTEMAMAEVKLLQLGSGAKVARGVGARAGIE